MKKLSILLLTLLSLNAFASPVTTDYLYSPDGLTIQVGNATITAPTTLGATGNLTTSNSTDTMANKTFAVSSNVGKQFRGLYDFAVSGGATDLIVSMGSLPAKAVVTEGYMEVLTAFTGGATALFQIDSKATGDVMSAQPIGNLTAGAYLLKPTGTTATLIDVGASAQPVNAHITRANGTAGKAAIYLNYFLTQ